MTLRVALVDDHQPFRERLRALLQRDREIDIVAEAGSGQEILDIARTTEFDVVVMDIKLPGMSGIETTRRLVAMRPGTRVIGLSAFAEPHYVEAMLNAGAVGQFTKGDAGSDGLLRAIHSATVERPVFGANIPVSSAGNTTSDPAPERTRPTPEATSLGRRELHVLRMIARGLTSEQIARSLSVDPTMVDVYRRNIARKLNVTDDETLSDSARRWLLGRPSDE
jgi:DNA-binding NarL/FixJ family response regulator